MNQFRALIARLKREYGTISTLAEGIDMSVSAFSRGVRNENTIGVYACLRLAEFTGEHPSTVLVAAGKADVDAIIKRLYTTTGKTYQIGALDRRLLELEPDVKRELLRLVDQLSQRGARAKA